MSLPRATRSEKTVKRPIATIIGQRRPECSDMGLQTGGPTAYPWEIETI